MLKSLYFLLFPVLLVYPNGLLTNTYINYFFVIFVFCCFLLFDKSNKFQITIVNNFFLYLFIIVLLANIWSSLVNYNVEVFNYIASTFRYFSYFIIASLMVSTTNNKKQLIFWLKSFFFGFSLSLIVLFLDAYKLAWVEPIFKLRTFEDLNTLDVYFRAYGAYLSPISAGIFILNTLILTVSLLISKVLPSLKYTLFFAILSIFSLVSIFMTASRTALLAMFLILTVLVLFTKNKLKIMFVIIILSLLVYQSGVLDNYIQNIILRSQNESAFGKSALEGSGRVSTVVNSIKLFFEFRTVFVGVGPSEYSVGDNTFSYAHNGFLSLLFCYGAVGLILFFNTGKSLYKKYNVKYSENKIKRFITIYVSLFGIANLTTFITSDGPVTHFWLLSFLFFLYFTEFYIRYNTGSISKLDGSRNPIRC